MRVPLLAYGAILLRRLFLGAAAGGRSSADARPVSARGTRRTPALLKRRAGSAREQRIGDGRHQADQTHHHHRDKDALYRHCRLSHNSQPVNGKRTRFVPDLSTAEEFLETLDSDIAAD
jgi:hypothetical protein